MPLPSEFASLERWCPTWDVDGGPARSAARQASDYADVKAFYDAMLEAAPKILEHVGAKPLSDLAEEEASLLRLMLSFAEVIPAVEFYQQVRVIDGFPAEKFRLVDSLPDAAPQE